MGVPWLPTVLTETSQDRDNHTMNTEVLLLNLDRCVPGVLGNKLRSVPTKPQTLDRRLAGQRCYDDIAIRRSSLFTNHDGVPIKDGGVAHAVPVHPKSKEAAAPKPA
jgi:hypothetical protein